MTSGRKLDEFIKDKWARGDYADYFLWHGFGAELTEALAEYIHFKIRQELGLEAKKRPDYAASLRKNTGAEDLVPATLLFHSLRTRKRYWNF